MVWNGIQIDDTKYAGLGEGCQRHNTAAKYLTRKTLTDGGPEYKHAKCEEDMRRGRSTAMALRL